MMFYLWVEITAGGSWDREWHADTLCEAIRRADMMIGHKRSRYAKPVLRCRVTLGEMPDGWASLCYEARKR